MSAFESICQGVSVRVCMCVYVCVVIYSFILECGHI